MFLKKVPTRDHKPPLGSGGQERFESHGGCIVELLPGVVKGGERERENRGRNPKVETKRKGYGMVGGGRGEPTGQQTRVRTKEDETRAMTLTATTKGYAAKGRPDSSDNSLLRCMSFDYNTAGAQLKSLLLRARFVRLLLQPPAPPATASRHSVPPKPTSLRGTRILGNSRKTEP